MLCQSTLAVVSETAPLLSRCSSMIDTTLEYAPVLPSRRILHQPDDTFDNSDDDDDDLSFISYNNQPSRSWQLPPWRTVGDQQDAPLLRGWRLPSRTWNQWTSPWTKQLTRLRIIHSGDWCLCLALRTHSDASQKWMNEWMCLISWNISDGQVRLFARFPLCKELCHRS